MWIKICGNTNLEDALFAAECGADAVGFVFASSPRRVDADGVRQITPRLPTQLETYGVFVDAEFDEIAATVSACGLTGVQLHRSSDELMPSRLREQFPQLNILHVLHYGVPDFERRLKEIGQPTDAVLVDSSTARAVGGTGTSFDWNEARGSFLEAAPFRRVVAAGGLAPENVQQAIRTLRPWGVDVVSGVESTKGKKDRARVAEFIRMARKAAEEQVSHAFANL
jgi:phosphoribosylanthranilate isomerase